MFVPTHYYSDKDGAGDLQIVGIYNDICHLVDHRGSGVGFLNKKALAEYYKPITLPCPSCNTELQQSERVQCECGVVLKAIDEEMLEFLQVHSLDSDDKWDSAGNEVIGIVLTCMTVNYPECKDSKKAVIYHIKGIHFLQIQGGKSDE